jgi:hypothetical protein
MASMAALSNHRAAEAMPDPAAISNIAARAASIAPKPFSCATADAVAPAASAL